MTSPHDLHRTNGFTLIEVMIVLAILSLTVAMAVPLLGKRQPGAALAGATGEIRAALHAARAEAIAQGREVAFSSDAGGGYRIDGKQHRLDGASSGLRIQIRGGSRISFFPSGGSSGGRLVLHGANARREIEIEAITGRVFILP
jgi:general secretion pathway protein H